MKIKLIALSLILLGLASFYLSKKYLSNSQAPINENDLTGKYDPTQTAAVFHKQIFKVPSEEESLQEQKTEELETDVLGSKKKKGPKRIEVDLTKQKLYAFEGSKKVYSFVISSGKWGATPTGEYTIGTKLRYTTMTGGSKALGTYYYLPNVPYVMYFYQGYGIHGAYWHNNFGHPMSHGCINMKVGDAKKLFDWASPTLPSKATSIRATKDNPGTKIIIYGKAPNE